MKFSFAAITAVLGAVSVAAETVTVSDLIVERGQDGKVITAAFKLNGDDAKNLACKSNDITLGWQHSDARPCGKSMYSFNLVRGSDSDYSVMIFHAYPEPIGEGYFSPGQYGGAFPNVNCKASKNGSTCRQVGTATAILSEQ